MEDQGTWLTRDELDEAFEVYRDLWADSLIEMARKHYQAVDAWEARRLLFLRKVAQLEGNLVVRSLARRLREDNPQLSKFAALERADYLLSVDIVAEMHSEIQQRMDKGS